MMGKHRKYRLNTIELGKSGKTGRKQGEGDLQEGPGTACNIGDLLRGWAGLSSSASGSVVARDVLFMKDPLLFRCGYSRKQ